jgi:hypothetical protein
MLNGQKDMSVRPSVPFVYDVQFLPDAQYDNHVVGDGMFFVFFHLKTWI